jgi:hypothetical protein
MHPHFKNFKLFQAALEPIVEEGEAVVTAVMVEDALGEEMDEEVRQELPKHRRCAAHTVNLMATNDIGKVGLNPVFRLKTL